MKRVVVLLLAIALGTSALGQTPPDHQSLGDDIRQQTERYFDSIDRRDAATLDDLLVDEFMVFYPRALRDTKAALLKTLAEPPKADEPGQAAHTLADVKLRQVGDTAVVTAMVTAKRGDAAGVTNRRTLTWARENGRWRLVHDEWALVGDAQEAEFWSDYFRAGNRNFNRKPNALLASAIEGRRPGTALDVGMGSGRNAILLAKQGWDVTGIDRAEGALAVARKQAIEQGVKITPVLQAAEEFDWDRGRWDLIALLYFHAVRQNMVNVRQSIKPGGLVVVEAFLADPGARGGGVKYQPGELRKLFAEGFTILRYEEGEGVADYGQKKTQLVRLVAQKNVPQASCCHGPAWRLRASSRLDGLRARPWRRGQ